MDIRISDLVIENKHGFIALNKPAELPVQSDLSGDKSLKDIAEIYCKTKLHLINRLDRPASGVVIMSKKKSFTAHLNKLQKEDLFVKEYLAITSKADLPKEGKLKHYLTKDGKQRKSIVSESSEESEAKVSVLDYKVIHELDNYFVLNISLKTGRFHQIRAQLAEKGFHVKGDVKYGARRKNKDRSIYLHSYKYHFTDPVSKKNIVIEAPLPENDNIWSIVKEKLASK
jgi:23S rRNA pseudouridine1911/1915/1917 synthase